MCPIDIFGLVGRLTIGLVGLIFIVKTGQAVKNVYDAIVSLGQIAPAIEKQTVAIHTSTVNISNALQPLASATRTFNVMSAGYAMSELPDLLSRFRNFFLQPQGLLSVGRFLFGLIQQAQQQQPVPVQQLNPPPLVPAPPTRPILCPHVGLRRIQCHIAPSGEWACTSPTNAPRTKQCPNPLLQQRLQPVQQPPQQQQEQKQMQKSLDDICKVVNQINVGLASNAAKSPADVPVAPSPPVSVTKDESVPVSSSELCDLTSCGHFPKVPPAPPVGGVLSTASASSTSSTGSAENCGSTSTNKKAPPLPPGPAPKQ
jgi:hypothetical protein